MQSPLQTTQRIKQRALDLGFNLAGVARAEPLGEDAGAFRRWLERGQHAGMSWMANRPERRTDPREVLENCRSVVVVGVNYHIPEDQGQISTESSHDSNPISGKVAQYARWEDYHRAIGKKLRILSRQILDEFPGEADAKWYVDTGPVLERAWAQRAGLGFIGKNTCLIHPVKGSWFFLGVILTTLELEVDEPIENRCGTCTRCLDACPTDAFSEPGVLDSNRCLSYLTIEHRNDVDEELKPYFEGWLFGCDVCQEVCPYNVKFSAPASHGGMLGEPVLGETVELDEILQIRNEDQFIERFGRRSVLRRAKLAGLQRTVKILQGG